MRYEALEFGVVTLVNMVSGPDRRFRGLPDGTYRSEARFAGAGGRA